MASKVNYKVPTWSQIYDMLLNIAQKIESQNFRPDIIVGIARGGLVPARILTDLLETPQLGFIEVEFYKDIQKTLQKPILKQTLATPVSYKKTLIVDDIADTGESLKLAEIHLQLQGASQIKTATLYQKPQSTTTPDFYEKQTSSWVVFPWEPKETMRKIIQKQQGKRALNQEVAKLIRAGLPKQLAEKLLKNML